MPSWKASSPKRSASIRITTGAELLQPFMIRTASVIIGVNVPTPFYQGFPESVRKLTIPELLIDQLLHYYNTYGQDNFDEAGHSVFEEEIERNRRARSASLRIIEHL